MENNELGRDAGKMEGVVENCLREKCVDRLVKKNVNEASDETAGGREIQRSREWRDEIKREWGILDDYRYHRWATVLPTTVARVPTYRRESTILGYYRYFFDTGVRDVWQTEEKRRKRREGKR